MFKLDRFIRLSRWTIAHSPAWYMVVPLIGIGLSGAALLLFDDFLQLRRAGDEIKAISPYYLRNLFLYANLLTLGIIAAHFTGSLFRTQRKRMDYLSLPVSSAERYLLLFIGVFVIIPLLGYISSFVAVGIFRLLLPFFWWPDWQWIPGLIGFSLLPYCSFALLIFALGLLRPRHTFIWALGVILCGAAIHAVQFLLIGNRSQLFMDLGAPPTAADPDVFGPVWPSEEVSFHVIDSLTAGSAPLLVALAVFSASLFLLSAWFTLKNTQA